ncbi:transient receptor potential cation channel subfamily M member-like 2 [Brevipalpus obovatus]|uniref:transient receptor potential cation channel subfamily M member-like 2 n=1 Tax=Brevipalpus obovatus TaxID=246614 RepID=UPI003D9F94CA
MASKESVKSEKPAVSKAHLGKTNPEILGSGGVLFYRNYSFEQKARPFFYVSHDIKMENLVRKMRKFWRVVSPRVVAMIISDTKSFKNWSNPAQVTNLQNGLIKAADTTNMWIMTHGADIGISKVIGDAVNEKIKELHFLRDEQRFNPQAFTRHYSLNFIGLIRDDQLRSPGAFHNNTVIDTPNQSDWPKVRVEGVGNLPEQSKFELNPDHSHFIIVQDKSKDKQGFNNFIMKMMRYLSVSEVSRPGLVRTESDQDLCSVTMGEVPMVGLLIRGAVESSILVYEFLKSMFPVVVLQGTSGYADILSFAFQEIHDRYGESATWGDWDQEFITSYLAPEVRTRISRNISEISNNSSAIDQIFDRLMDSLRLAIVDQCLFLTVINTSSTEFSLENISEDLLRALFRSRPRSPDAGREKPDDDRIRHELHLAIDWNCVDVARTDIVPQDPLFLSRLPRDVFMVILFHHDREHFTDLVLSNGFRIHSFLSPLRLRKLFLYSYEEDFFRKVCWEGVLGHSQSAKPGRNFIDDDFNYLIWLCTGINDFVNSDYLFYNLLTLYVLDASAAERHTMVILAMWAAFSKRFKLIRVLWKHCDAPIHMALFMHLIFIKLAPYVEDSNIQNSLRKEAKTMADMAIGVLDECYERSASRVFDLLGERSPEWKGFSIIDLAVRANLKRIIAHPACQVWLSNEFLGDIYIREVTWGAFSIPVSVKIILSAYLLWPMYFWIRFQTTEKVSKQGSVLALKDIEAEEQKYHDKYKGKDPSSGPTKNTRWIDNFRAREHFVFQGIPFCRMIYMMWTAPITKFYNHFIALCFFIALAGYTLLLPSCSNTFANEILTIWLLALVIEYVRRGINMRMAIGGRPHLVPNQFELIMACVFSLVYAGNVFGLDMGILTLSAYQMKVFLAFLVILSFYKLMIVFLKISPTLGPMIYRIQLMVVEDFIQFMKICIILILAGGMVMQALFFPDGPFESKTIRAALDRAWIGFFSTSTKELEKTITNTSCPANDDPDSCKGSYYDDPTGLECPVVSPYSYSFYVLYLTFVKLILLTLLYALFANSGKEIEAQSDEIWKYQRYTLIDDLSYRLTVPCPFNLLVYPCMLIRYFYQMIKRCCTQCCCCQKSAVKGGRESLCTCKGISNFFCPPQSEQTEWDKEKHVTKISREDYGFWSSLALKYSDKMEYDSAQKQISQRTLEDVRFTMEQVEEQKNLSRRMNIRLTELERILRVKSSVPVIRASPPEKRPRSSSKSSNSSSLGSQLHHSFKSRRK